MGSFDNVKKIFIGLVEIVALLFKDFIIISIIAAFAFLFHNYVGPLFNLSGENRFTEILETSHRALLISAYILFSIWDIYKYIKDKL